jgi:hypothetical protein
VGDRRLDQNEVNISVEKLPVKSGLPTWAQLHPLIRNLHRHRYVWERAKDDHELVSEYERAPESDSDPARHRHAPGLKPIASETDISHRPAHFSPRPPENAQP